MIDSPDVRKTGLPDAASPSSSTGNCVVHHEQQGGADDRHHQAVEVESGNTLHPEGVEKPATDDRADPPR
jgi:hypothetical protein